MPNEHVNGGAAGRSPALDIEELKRRHKDLDTQRTKARANLENAERQLDELKAEARAAYGTDDLDALREKLDEMRRENERKRAEYQAHLEQVQARLAEVEQTFAGAGSKG